jgi:hypothetical protein
MHAYEAELPAMHGAEQPPLYETASVEITLCQAVAAVALLKKTTANLLEQQAPTIALLLLSELGAATAALAVKGRTKNKRMHHSREPLAQCSQDQDLKVRIAAAAAAAPMSNIQAATRAANLSQHHQQHCNGLQQLCCNCAAILLRSCMAQQLRQALKQLLLQL